MITQVLLAVSYGGSLEIHPRSFQQKISLYMEGEETKSSGSDECRVNMLAFFHGRAKASQAARSMSLPFALRSPRVGAGFLPLSTITPPWLVTWGALILDVSSFPSPAWFRLSIWLSFNFFQLPGLYPFCDFFSLSLLSSTACDGANISGQ